MDAFELQQVRDDQRRDPQLAHGVLCVMDLVSAIVINGLAKALKASMTFMRA